MATVVDPQAFIEVLKAQKGYDPAQGGGTLNYNPADREILRQRMLDSREGFDRDMQAFDAPIYGHEAAPIIGLLRGISQRGKENMRQEELEGFFQEYRQQEEDRIRAAMDYQRQQAEAAEAQRQKERLEGRQDKMWEWQNKPPEQLSPKDRADMMATQARIAKIMQELDQGQAKEERQKAKFEADQAEAESKQEGAEQERKQALSIIDRMLSPERRGDLESATGAIQGALPSVRQGVVDWETDFSALNSLLTLDNLDRMTGVLSESDIKLLREAATGGLNLRSSDENVIRRLQEIRSALSGENASEPPPTQQGGGRFRILAEE